MQNKPKNNHISTFRLILLGFFGVIVVGWLLLMLPISTKSGEMAGASDALFTATSAVCVTGLVVQDTASYWSMFGQSVILLLIQIGGMGIVTVTVAFAVLSGKKIGLMQRSTMQEAISAHRLGGIIRLTNFIIKITFAIELIGMSALAPVFCKEYGLKGLWYALFHSVSAFCNAGFDLNGTEAVPFASMTEYCDSPLINVVLMLLIIVGGIGFLTWDDLKTNLWHFKKYRMQTKIILVVSAILIILPACFFFFSEFSHLPVGKRIWASLFQAVTPRTAGFNTVNIADISDVGKTIILILMLVGGSPGSTAGGMKTTTLAVVFLTSLSVFTKKESPHLFGRRISDEAVKSAATIFQIYLFMFVTGGMVISYIEGVPLFDALFEAASAIGTVGLSVGITPDLGLVSRLILICLMFFGRVGGLTVIFAALSEKKAVNSRYPEEKITVG